MIDFRTFQPDAEALAKAELARLPRSAEGHRLDISAPDIRAALEKWKQLQGIPIGNALSERERQDFELWFLMQKFQ